MRASEETPKWRPAALSLTVFGAIARLLPHPPNFAPVGATSVFAGGRLPAWQAYLVPLALMAVTDPIINASYGLPPFSAGRLWIYASLLIGVFIGRRVRNTENAGRIGAALFINALQFFLITNFASWLQSGIYVTVPTPYPHTLNGLFTCYVAALPFFGWTLLGDLTYGAVFFGLHAWLARSVSIRERVPGCRERVPA